MESRSLLCARLLSNPLRSAASRRSASNLAKSRPSPLRQSPARHFRCFHASPSRMASSPPKSRDRGPKSEEDTQTDFGMLDVLRNTAAPATSIDACTSDGFALNNQMRIVGSGVLLVAGEAFRWKPWAGGLVNAQGQWEVPDDAWGVLDLVWPKPDLLIIGTGPHMCPVAPRTRQHIAALGIRLEVQDTRNAAAQFNLLATERGVQQVAAAMIPVGWREKK